MPDPTCRASRAAARSRRWLTFRFCLAIAQLVPVLASGRAGSSRAGRWTPSYCDRARSSVSRRGRAADPSPAAPRPASTTPKGRQEQEPPPLGQGRYPRAHTARVPNLLMTIPLRGAGTGAPGGAGTSRRQEASRPAGRLPRLNCRNRVKTAHNSARSPGIFLPGALVRSPASCLGRHKRRGGACFRSLPSPWSSSRPRRSALPGRLSLPRRFRSENGTAGGTRRGRQSCSCIHSTSASSRPGRAPRCARPGRLPRSAPSARVSRISSRSRRRGDPAGAGTARGQAPPLLYESGNVEPLEILFGAKNLDDAPSSLDNLSRMSAQGEDVLNPNSPSPASCSRTAQANLSQREAAINAAAAAARKRRRESLSQTRAARASYLSSLATQRRLNDHQISAFVARGAGGASPPDARAPACDGRSMRTWRRGAGPSSPRRRWQKVCGRSDGHLDRLRAPGRRPPGSRSAGASSPSTRP